MDARRLRIDPFAFALGALALLTFGFFAARNGAAVIMCALCLAGLLAARLVGFSNRALVPLAAGLVVLLWVLWVDPPPLSTNQTSALAHGTRRAAGRLGGLRVPARPGRVAAVGDRRGRRRPRAHVLWELGEYVGDRALDTGADPEQARLGARHRLRHPRRRRRHLPGDAAAGPRRAIAWPRMSLHSKDA